MFDLVAGAVSAVAKTVQTVVQLYSGITNMLTISKGDTQRPVKLREDVDRRVQEDRRRSSVDMRLRVGLWYQYHRATRAGEFDPFPRNQYLRAKVEEALLPEMLKYEFRLGDKDTPILPSFALSSALDFLWSHAEIGCNAAGESMAVYALNAVAEHLSRTHNVAVVDRRKADRRSAKAASGS
jgi:hypothetical protein